MTTHDVKRPFWISLLLATWLAASPASGQFQPGYAKPGPSGIGPVEHLILFDDGGGEKLYAYGNYSRIDGELMTGLVYWDGTQWQPTSASSPGADIRIFDLRVLDVGAGPRLFVFGDFEEFYGVQANNIAFWDGTTWTAFGLPTSPIFEPREVFVYDDGGGPVFYASVVVPIGPSGELFLWRWDGGNWQIEIPSAAIKEGTLIWDDGSGEKVFGEGLFSGSSEFRFFRWDGTTVEFLAEPPVDDLRGMTVADMGDGERLYLIGTVDSGDFSNDTGRLISWDGTAWRTEFDYLPPGFSALANPTFYNLGDGPRLGFSAGPAFGSDGVPISTAYSWDGTTLVELRSAGADAYVGITGALNDAAKNMVFFDDGSGPALYSGGRFRLDGLNAVQGLARWRGSSWEGVSKPGLLGMDLSARVYALESYDLGGGELLYAGGSLFTAGDVAAYALATFDGSSWSAMVDPAGPLVRSIRALEVFDAGDGPRLVAAGDFVRRNLPELCRLASWDGAAWQPILPAGGPCSFVDRIDDLAVFDDGTGTGEQLIAVGDFEMLDGVTYNHALSWDGTTLSTLAGLSGFGTDGAIHAAAVFNGGSGAALYVGGEFSEAGGVASPFLARWDGADWSTVGMATLDGAVEALEVFDDGSGPALYLGGSFSQIGALTVNGIARWDGLSFSALPGAGTVGVGGASPRVWALRAVDAGDGEKLYLSGPFDTAGGLTSPDLAIWHGEWSAPEGVAPSGFGGQAPWALGGYGGGEVPSLFVGGQFQTIYGQSSVGIGEYQIDPRLFVDGFESGDTSAWLSSFP